MILLRFFILIFVTIGFISNSFAVKSITITNSTNNDLLSCAMYEGTTKVKNTVPPTNEDWGEPTKIEKNKSQEYTFDADKQLSIITCMGGTKSWLGPWQYYTVCKNNCTTVTYVVTQNHRDPD